MNRRTGGHKYDAKQITMRKLVRMDNDLAPRFDDDEDTPQVQLSYSRGRDQRHGAHSRGGQFRGRGGRGTFSIISYLADKRDRQFMRGEGGKSSSTASSVMLNQIKVLRGVLVGKDFILRSIGQYVDDFKPLLVKGEKDDLLFFVEDDETAAAIRSISRRICDPSTNQPIVFFVRRCSAGFATITASERQLIKEVLEKRYNAAEHSLDLSEFGLDEVFKSRNLHLSLTRNNMMMAVVELIDKHFGDIIALSIKGNRLRYLDFFANLIYRIRNVKILDMSCNQIDKISELEKLRGWPVETFFFENNPICSTYNSAEAYLSAIHGVFPKVTSLDGIPVQRSSVSEIPDLDDFPKVPPSRPGFYSSDELRVLLETFIIEYMKLYDDPDTNNRKNLINAYEENATFSLTCENLPDANEKRPFTEQKTYVTYRRASHNILETERWKYYRDKRLQKGAMEIVVELRNLPATTHLMDTFLVDVSMVTARYIAFAVQGFFRDNVDRVTNKDEVKYFCRNFIVLNKEGGKLAIVSDMLFISGVFAERVQRYKTMLSAWLKAPPSVKQEQVEQPSVSSGIGGLNIADQPSTSGTSSAGNPAPLTPAQIAAAGDVHMQQQMIDAFSKESGMKPEWCRKCLEDQNWEYEVAGQVFLAVRDKIPAEAFL